jgi:hypothetical protein
MTSLSTWLRAATGSSRRGGLTRAPMLACRRRTRQAELPDHAIPRPGPPLSLPWSSSPASPDEIRAASRRGSRAQSLPRLPFTDGAPRLACPSQPGRRPGDGHLIKGHWALAPVGHIRLIRAASWSPARPPLLHTNRVICAAARMANTAHLRPILPMSVRAQRRLKGGRDERQPIAQFPACLKRGMAEHLPVLGRCRRQNMTS